MPRALGRGYGQMGEGIKEADGQTLGALTIFQVAWLLVRGLLSHQQT